ncbi:DUF58 domain-containing protein [Tepidiforma sp.]|uniref:DUF58 domain-containing protein n=1 Tax=Tepidiforma sp. TaxID=2682230 RepID=UPI002ADD59BB|nr:DUF58 domain-containing protein [Tepidiforma sp.]
MPLPRLPFRRRCEAPAAPQDGGLSPELLARVRAIELRARRLVNTLFLGEYHAIFRGRGIEFDELRPYVPGDDLRSLDWKAFARTGEPFIRRYREDRDLTVIFLVDISPSQFVGAGPTPKAALAAEIAAVLALAAIRNNDRVGALLFAAEAERYLRPAGGSTHVLRLIREILWARPRTRGTSISAALAYLIGVHRRRATVFLISDFLAPIEPARLRAAARRHDLIAISVRDPVDERLPDVGIVTLADAESGASVEVDTSSPAVREAYAARVRELDAARRRLFGELTIDEIRAEVGRDYVPELLRFFHRRGAAA